eukprot:69076_1
MATVLHDWKRKLIRQRDETNHQIKTIYKKHISALRMQQQTIIDKIQQEYETKIRHCEELIATHNEMIQLKLNFQQNLKTLLSANTNITRNDSSNTTAVLPSNEQEEDHVFMSRSISTTNMIIGGDVFVSHMTMDEAHQLVVNDMIDHRDIVGCSAGATIIAKQGTNLHIHYPGWGHDYDIWSDYNTELHKFAKHKSISLRPRHRLFTLKINDFVDVNPWRTEHKGWTIGTVEEIDKESGQIMVAYVCKMNGDESQEFMTWVHIDMKEELAPLHTYSSAEQMQIHDETGSVHSSTDMDESTATSVSISEHLTRRKKRKLNDANKPKRKKRKSNDIDWTLRYDISVNCHECKQSFDDIDLYVIHLKDHYDSDPSKTWKICEFCPSDKVFSASKVFIYHISSHTHDYPFICATCGHRSSQPCNFKTHWKSHHGNDQST